MFVTMCSAISSTEMESCPGIMSASLRRLLSALCSSALEEGTALSTRSLLITLPHRSQVHHLTLLSNHSNHCHSDTPQRLKSRSLGFCYITSSRTGGIVQHFEKEAFGSLDVSCP